MPTAAPKKPFGSFVLLGIVTLVLAVFFLIWSIVILVRCGKKNKPLPMR